LALTILTRRVCSLAPGTRGSLTSACQCIDEVTPTSRASSATSRDNPMNDARACARLEAGCAARGEARRGVRSVGRGNNGNAYGSLGIGSVRPHPRESLQTGCFSERAPPGANVRAHRTQEVAGSSPASSIRHPCTQRPFRGTPNVRWLAAASDRHLFVTLTVAG